MASLKQLEPIAVRQRETLEIKISATSEGLQPGEKLIFSVRKAAGGGHDYIVKRELPYGSDTIILTSAETAAIAPGSYLYDIWLIAADGKSIPLCAPSAFEVKGAVYNG